VLEQAPGGEDRVDHADQPDQDTQRGEEHAADEALRGVDEVWVGAGQPGDPEGEHDEIDAEPADRGDHVHGEDQLAPARWKFHAPDPADPGPEAHAAGDAIGTTPADVGSGDVSTKPVPVRSWPDL
jgi:hypothetical protein